MGGRVRNAEDSRPRNKPSRAAIFLSGFLYPGAGQLAQRRWVAGVGFVAGFSFLLALFMVQSLRTIVAFYELGLRGTETDQLPSLASIGVLFAACLAVYVLNIVDAWLAYRRAARRHAWQRHIDPEIVSILMKEEAQGQESLQATPSGKDVPGTFGGSQDAVGRGDHA